MDGLSIGQQNNAKEATFHLFKFHPPSNATISLDSFTEGIGYRPLNLFVKNNGSVRTLPDLEEVPCEFHASTVPKKARSLRVDAERPAWPAADGGAERRGWRSVSQRRLCGSLDHLDAHSLNAPRKRREV